MEPAEAPEASGRACRVTRALDVLTASGWPLTQVAGFGPLCLSLRVWCSSRFIGVLSSSGFPVFFFENCFLFLAVLGPRRCAGLSPAVASRGRSAVAVPGLLPAVLSLAGRGRSGTGPALGGHGLSCSAGCGVFLGQGSGLPDQSPALAGSCPGFPFLAKGKSEAPFSRRQRKY